MKFLKLLVVGLILMGQSRLVAAEPPKVEKDNNGWFYAEYELKWGHTIRYQVDSVAQLCFARGQIQAGAPEIIDCKDLAKRAEWKPIITWVQQPSTDNNNKGSE